MSSIDMPARSNTLAVAGIGAVSMRRGSAPARAKSTNRARGVRPSSLAFSSVMIRSAAEPSVICDELPAVTLPPSSSGRNDGFSLASDSSVVSRRPSSTFISAPSAPSTGRISRSKRPSVGRPGGPLLALRAEGVHVLAGDAPLLGDQLGGDALGHEAALVGVAGADLGAERVAELAVGHRRPHRHTGHHLDAGGDDDVVGAGDHALGGEVGGLLARPALAVDGGARDVLGPAGGEHGVAGDVHALLADLHHAAHDDVVDDRRVDAGAVDERLQRLGGEVDRVPVLELAVALPERGADGLDDHGGGHRPSLLPNVPATQTGGLLRVLESRRPRTGHSDGPEALGWVQPGATNESTRRKASTSSSVRAEATWVWTARR